MATSEPVELGATLDAASVTTLVRVLTHDAAARLSGLAPAAVRVVAGDSTDVALSLDLPAPAPGITVTFALSPPELGSIASEVVLPYDALGGEVTLTAGAAGVGTLTATAGSDSFVIEVEVQAWAPRPLDGLSVIQTSSSATLLLPSGLVLEPGASLVIARDAEQAAFEAYWGASLPSGALFVNAGGALPLLNGDETFTLAEGETALDGPTPAFATGRCLTRATPIVPAADPAAFVESDAAITTNATPGSGPLAPGLFISEVCDGVGNGNYVYEFVEVTYGGAP